VTDREKVIIFGNCYKTQPFRWLWPEGQGEEKPKAFIELIRERLGDQNIDLWFLDECSIEGDPRPRRRFATKGTRFVNPIRGLT